MVYEHHDTAADIALFTEKTVDVKSMCFCTSYILPVFSDMNELKFLCASLAVADLCLLDQH